MEPTPLWVSSYTRLLYKVQDPFHACRQSKGRNKVLLFYNLEDQSLFHRSINSGREFVGWNQFLCRSVLTPVSCTRFKIHSTHEDSPRTKTNFFFHNLEDQSLFHRSINSGREFVGWNQLLCRSVLTPVSCTKFKIHSTHAHSPRVETNFFSSTIWRTSLCFTDQETREENLLGGTNSFVGQFLHPSLVKSSRSISRMQTVQGP